MAEERDRLIDVLLREILGGEAPPDVAGKVLQRAFGPDGGGRAESKRLRLTNGPPGAKLSGNGGPSSPGGGMVDADRRCEEEFVRAADHRRRQVRQKKDRQSLSARHDLGRRTRR